jgi:hypothetical protein
MIGKRISMKSGVIGAAGLLMLISAAGAQDPATDAASAPVSPAPEASVVAAPSPGASPSQSAAAPETITPGVGKRLLREFQAAQSSELKGMKHRHKLELKELKASQAARKKEWEKREKEARHKFFAENRRGPDRRAYITDFIERRRAFFQMLTDERNQRVHEQEVREKALKNDQAQRLKEFKEALARNEAPPTRLWPGAS